MDSHTISPSFSSSSSSPPSVSSSPGDSHDHATIEHVTSSNDTTGGLVASSQDEQAQDETELTSLDATLERHPKGKRKRTAAKDKGVLEAAYNANPKPDKPARLEIVSRVSLNEKEVQIWFQNRRQNDRRKSRPLSPQEIAALRYGSMQIISSDPLIPYHSSINSDGASTSPNQSSLWLDRAPTSPNHPDPTGVNLKEDSNNVDRASEDGCLLPEMAENANREAASSPPQEPSPDASRQLSQSFSSAVGYLSNRWNPGSSFSTPSTIGLRGEDSLRLESFASSGSSSTPVLPPPSSQTSQFRICLSLEGKAKIVSSLQSPPNLAAPRPSVASLLSLGPIPRPNFQRSHSASPSVTLPPISTLTGSLSGSTSGALPPRLTRGRSRDVHAWEFCCDAKNQEDPLTAQAKHESSGSAIAAISLLRSTSASTGNALQPNNSKRNATASRAAPRGGMAKKARLSRTHSSVARLQTDLAAPEKKLLDKDETGKLKVAMLLSPSGNDSDKENWSPDEDGNPQHRQQLPSGRRPLPSGSVHPKRRTLHEQRNPVFRANTTPLMGRRRGGKHGASPLEIFEDEEGGSEKPSPAVDEEVERFMRGEVSPSKKGDVDAVAGLLSLSQGNWR